MPMLIAFLAGAQNRMIPGKLTDNRCDKASPGLVNAGCKANGTFAVKMGGRARFMNESGLRLFPSRGSVGRDPHHGEESVQGGDVGRRHNVEEFIGVAIGTWCLPACPYEGGVQGGGAGKGEWGEIVHLG